MAEGNHVLAGPDPRRGKGREAAVTSAAVHLLLFAIIAAGALDWLTPRVDEPFDTTSKVQVSFLDGGTSSAGEAGRSEPDVPAPSPAEPTTSEAPPAPVKEPVIPRKPRPIDFERLQAPDLPEERVAELLPSDAPDVPEIEPVRSAALGGVAARRAPATSRVGRGSGTGVGDGRGAHARGNFDEDPELVFKPEAPTYPEGARERMIAGEVILEVLVKIDGSTEVLGVIKSLPHCVEAAKENARLWRWKPARKDGRPVEATGIITVTFDLFSSSKLGS